MLPLLFRGCRLRRRCPFSLVRPPLWRRCSALRVRAFSVPHATSRAFRCAAGRRGRPFLSPSQSREPHFSAFAPCERREVCGLPKHCFELNAPLGGAGFPVLECPSLFAPLALTRCGRLARRVFPGCKEAFSASDRNTTRKLTFSICAACQGRAARGGRFANLDSRLKLRVRLLRVVVLRCVCCKVFFPLSRSPKGGRTAHRIIGKLCRLFFSPFK